MHCGRTMHKEGDQLVCWMGASCGTQPIPKHHGKTMEIVNAKIKQINKIKKKLSFSPSAKL